MAEGLAMLSALKKISEEIEELSREKSEHEEATLRERGEIIRLRSRLEELRKERSIHCESIAEKATKAVEIQAQYRAWQQENILLQDDLTVQSIALSLGQSGAALPTVLVYDENLDDKEIELQEAVKETHARIEAISAAYALKECERETIDNRQRTLDTELTSILEYNSALRGKREEITEQLDSLDREKVSINEAASKLVDQTRIHNNELRMSSDTLLDELKLESKAITALRRKRTKLEKEKEKIERLLAESVLCECPAQHAFGDTIEDPFYDL